MLNGSSQSIVAKKWSEYEPELEKCFFGFPYLRHYLIKLAFGDQLAVQHQNNRFWSEDIVSSKYLSTKKIENVMSLCCGFGSVEQRIIPQLPDIKKCIAVDIAPGALDVAKQRSKAAKLDHLIDYRCCDVNTYSWEEGEYDLVIANGALHHLANLEVVIRGIKLSLRRGGIVYANEYVGESYQDYTVRQLELINSISYMLPPELRQRIGIPFRHSHTVLLMLYKIYKMLDGSLNKKYADDTSSNLRKNRIKGVIANLISGFAKKNENKFNFGIVHDSQKDYFLKTDPSEGVKSADIIPLINAYFKDVEIHPYGGGILAYALDSFFYMNYNNNNALHKKTLDTLCQLEEHFMQTDQIGAEHAIIIASN